MEVFVQNPDPGLWLVEVIASEVNEDSHIETPEVDADFALVVSGVGQPIQGIPPESFEVIHGTVVSGKLPDVLESDDSYLSFHPEQPDDPAEPPVWVVFDGTLPSDSPATLSFTIEGAVDTVGLTQSIEMFNFQSKEFELVDTREVPLDSEETIEINVSKNIDEYVQPGTGRITTRVGWRVTSPVLFHPWTVRLDQVNWRL